MKLVGLFVELLIGLAWPMVVIAFLFIFRSSVNRLIEDLFQRTEKVSGFGLEASFSALDKLNENLQSTESRYAASSLESTVTQQSAEHERSSLDELHAAYVELANARVDPLSTLEKAKQSVMQRYEEANLGREIDLEKLRIYTGGLVARGIEKKLDKQTMQEVVRLRDELEAGVTNAIRVLQNMKADFSETFFPRVIAEVEETLTQLKDTRQPNVPAYEVAENLLSLRVANARLAWLTSMTREIESLPFNLD